MQDNFIPRQTDQGLWETGLADIPFKSRELTKNKIDWGFAIREALGLACMGAAHFIS
jgi:hypothetical protein